MRLQRILTISLAMALSAATSTSAEKLLKFDVLNALEAGLHAVYAIAECDAQREISRPVTIMFQERQ